MLSNFKKQLQHKKELYLRVKARPSSPKTEVKEILSDNTVKINIHALPEKNKANIELIKFLAGEFKVNKNNIKIISGAGDKIKLIKIKI